MAPSKKQKLQELPTICVLGATGVGKGSTLNSCFRTDKYGTSAGQASDTIKPASFVLPWRGSGELVRGVDLCGFSDSEGRDTGFIEAMVAYLREEVRHVNCFLLLLNSQEPRIGMHLKDMLMALKSVFGLSFMGNVLIGFTRWDYSRKGAILRRGLTKDVLRANVNDLLKTLLGHEHECECIFVDNTINMFTAEELQELYTCSQCKGCSEELTSVAGEFEGALETVRRAALTNEAFPCVDIQSTLAERDIGRDMIQREKDAVAKGEDAFAAFVLQWQNPLTQEPSSLQDRLDGSARDARVSLEQWLSARCKPDLEHVMQSVLDAFDGRLKESVKGLVFKNRMGASSFNRYLRMGLVSDYKTFLKEQCAPEGAADGGSLSPQERFQSTQTKYTALLVDYVCKCQGGSLAWQPFVVLQDQLRMEQVDAREKLLRADLKEGKPLPPISESARDAKALLALVRGVGGELLGGRSVPDWLVALSEQGLVPRSHAGAIG
jgi:hypothetical protein